MKKIVIVIFVLILFCIIVICGTFYKRWEYHSSTILRQTVSSLSQKSIKEASVSSINHIVILTMENRSFSDIVKNSNAPYINSLIHHYSFANNYFAVSHPSLPNYLALTGGDTFGISSDCTNCYINATNLTDQLEKTHKTWKAYMESMPSACFIGSSGEYAQKHDPFIYFDDIRNNQRQCDNIVPYSELSTDLISVNTTPDFIWISPNLCDDMHDCSTLAGDTWLSTQIPKILTSPAFTKQKSLLVITWDEGENISTNQVPTIFVGNVVKSGFTSHTLYSHYSLLHTIESSWGLSPLTNNVAQSNIISDIFK